jgi:hypothetical protein
MQIHKYPRSKYLPKRQTDHTQCSVFHPACMWLSHDVAVLGAFAKLRNRLLALPFLSVFMHVCPFVWLYDRMEQLGSHWRDFHENIQLSRKFNFDWNLSTATGTVHENLCTFMIICRRSFLGVRNVSENSCRGNRNTHFIFTNFLQKIMPSMG